MPAKMLILDKDKSALPLNWGNAILRRAVFYNKGLPALLIDPTQPDQKCQTFEQREDQKA